MSDLENKEDGAIHLTDEELEFIRELEQEEEDILSGKKAMKGMAGSDGKETAKRDSEGSGVSAADVSGSKASETRASETGRSESRGAEARMSETRGSGSRESERKASESGSATSTGGEALQDRTTGERPASRSGLFTLSSVSLWSISCTSLSAPSAICTSEIPS